MTTVTPANFRPYPSSTHPSSTGHKGRRPGIFSRYCFALAILLWGAPSFRAWAQTNLALGKPVTFSGQQTGNEADKAVDGNTTTRWAVSPWPQWLEVDLGATYNLSKTEIVPYADRAYQYKVEVKTSATGSYTTVADATGNTTGGALLSATFAQTSARYVKLTITGAAGYTGGWATLYEFRVLGQAPATGGGTTCGSAGGGTTGNPVSAFYGSTAYPWTDNIKWNCVYNILDYGGNGNGTADNTGAFNAARDAAAANGGGVVYFPAGTFYFAGDILLKNGVVIRGATPATTDAKSSTFAPASRLTFPKYNPTLSGSGTDNATAFKKIRTTSPDTDSNTGLVYVEVNRAGISLTGNKDTGTNKNILLFGVRNNNVAEADPGVPALTYNSVAFQNAWQRWSYRFAANLRVQAFENVLVANNRVNDNITDNFQQGGYVARDGTALLTLTGEKAIFSYTNHYGIYVNRAQGGDLNTPATGPGLFRQGVVVRDNWVYGTMRVKIHASGLGLIIKDNVLRDEPGKVAWLDPTGTRLVGNSATLENRGIDWGGHNVTVTGNNVQVNRHKLKNTIYYSVDGEGILIQECCGGTTVRGVTIGNNTTNNYIGIYKMRDIENVTIADNTITKGDGGLGDLIYVSANHNTGPYQAKNVKIENNSVSGGNIGLYANGGTGTGNTILNNTTSTTGATIRHSCEANASVSGNTGFTVNACTGAAARVAADGALEELESRYAPALYPLPAGEYLNVDLYADCAQDLQLSLLSPLAQPVRHQTHSLSPGMNHLRIPVGSLRGGTYVLRIQSAKGVLTKKVVISR